MGLTYPPKTGGGGGGGGGDTGPDKIRIWDDDVTYHADDQVLYNGALWVSNDTNDDAPPGADGDTHWAAAVGPAPVAADVSVDPELQRLLTATSVQDQLIQADFLLRFLTPGGSIAGYRGAWNPEDAYYPGDAVAAYEPSTTDKWWLYLCKALPGLPEDGSVDQYPIDNTDIWQGICLEAGWAAAIDLRDTRSTDLMPNDENIPTTIAVARSDGQTDGDVPFTSGSYRFHLRFPWGDSDTTIPNFDQLTSDEELLDILNQCAGTEDAFVVLSRTGVATWTVSAVGPLAGVSVEIVIEESSLNTGSDIVGVSAFVDSVAILAHIPGPPGSTIRMQSESGTTGSLWEKFGYGDDAWQRPGTALVTSHAGEVWNQDGPEDTVPVFDLVDPDQFAAWSLLTDSKWGYVIYAEQVAPGSVFVTAALLFTTGVGFNAGTPPDPSTLEPNLSLPEVVPTGSDLGGLYDAQGSGYWLDDQGIREQTHVAVEQSPEEAYARIAWQEANGNPSRISVPMEGVDDSLQVVFSASFTIPGTIDVG